MAANKPWRGPRIRNVAGMFTTLICAAWLYLYLAEDFRSVSYVPKATGPDIGIFREHAVNNTVVIVPVNRGMLHWAENLLCSLVPTNFDTSNIVFWSLDADAKNILERRGFAAYHDPSLFSTSNNENARGDTKAYRRMMQERPKFFIDVLSSGVDILMLDADTVYFQSPLLIRPDAASYGNVDVVYSTDAREFYQDRNAFQDVRRRGYRMPPICNGIFWMKSNPATISLWSEMLAVFQRPWPLGFVQQQLSGFQDDQRGMDVLLNDGRASIVGPLPGGLSPDELPTVKESKHKLNVTLLDQTQVVNGYLLQTRLPTYQQNLANLRQAGRDRIGAHFNWNSRVTSKEEGSKSLGMFFLNDAGVCKFAH